MPTPVSSSNANQEAYRAQVANNQGNKQLESMTSNLKAAEKMGRALGTDTTGVQNALQRVSSNQEQGNSSTRVSLSSEGVARLQAEKAAPAASANPQANAQGGNNSASAASGVARPERRQFSSVDEALAYGASRAAEQASTRATARTASANGETNSPAASAASPAATTNKSPVAAQSTSPNAAQSSVASSNRPERRQFSSVDEALAYGASRATEQAANRAPVVTPNAGDRESTNATNTQNEVDAANRSDRRRFNSVDEAISYGAQRAVEQYSKQQSVIRGTV
jgi:hypothetical protein